MTDEQVNPVEFPQESTAEILENELKKTTMLASPYVAIPEKGMGQYTFPSTYKESSPIPAEDRIQTIEVLKRLGSLPANQQYQVVVPVTDKDTNVIDKKRKVYQQAQFDEWFATHYNMAGPAEREHLKRIYPQYFENKIKLNHDIHQFQEDIARISIKGPENYTDLCKMYTLQNPDIYDKVFGETGPIRQTPNQNAESYQQGIFAGRKWYIGRFTSMKENAAAQDMMYGAGYPPPYAGAPRMQSYKQAGKFQAKVQLRGSDQVFE